MKEFIRDHLTEIIIGCSYKVHNSLGPGFLEKVYSRALQQLLNKEKIIFEAEKEFKVFFERSCVGNFRCDLFIDQKVIVELKSVTGIMPKLFTNQLISYLKASNIKTGLLINFGNTSCEVKRISL